MGRQKLKTAFLTFYTLIMNLPNYPCLLLINDLHIGKENIPEFTANWNEALEICERMGITEIAIGGDLFNSRVSQTLDILLAVHGALISAANRGIRVVLANGNHCKVNPESAYGYCHVYNQHRNVVVVDNYLTLPVGHGEHAVLHIIPYFPEDGSFTDKLEEVKQKAIDPSKRNFLYIHQGINEALSQPNEKELPPGIFKEFDKVFVAHYHNRCTVKPNIEYIGSSRQHNFGEDEMKGYTVLYSNGSHEFIRNQANIRYKVIDVDAGQANTHLKDRLEEIRQDGRYRTKVRVHGSAAQTSNINKQDFLQAGASKVEVVTEEATLTDVPSADLSEKFDGGKIRESYQEFCRVKDINVEPGMDYLSKVETPCGNYNE